MNDATNQLKDNVRRYLIEHPQANRRLTYSERCGVFYALYWGYSRGLVAEAFGIHNTTVSLICEALSFNRPPRKPGQKRPELVRRDEHGNALPPEPPEIHPENMRRKSVYQDIAREFLALGPDAFGEKYINQDIVNRLLEAEKGREGRKPRRTMR
jgi:hypothetical protein